MDILEINPRPGIELNEKYARKLKNFEHLIEILRKRQLPDDVVNLVNEEIAGINVFTGTDKRFIRRIDKSRSKIFRFLEKRLKLVPRNFYRWLWTGAGMAAFGLPFGLALSLPLGNMAFVGIGLPIGMAIGMAIGKGMDDKARSEGRQLDCEIRN